MLFMLTFHIHIYFQLFHSPKSMSGILMFPKLPPEPELKLGVLTEKVIETVNRHLGKHMLYLKKGTLPYYVFLIKASTRIYKNKNYDSLLPSADGEMPCSIKINLCSSCHLISKPKLF